MQNKKFTRCKENFNCEHCGHHTQGNGYTDHCPNCLWSKHVDVNPGDRAATCHGLMEPVAVNQEKGQWKIDFKCQDCGHHKKNKASEGDSFEEIVKLSNNKS